MDDEMPRRRRGARAVAVEEERGLAMRILLHSPKDMIAGLLAAAAIGAILTNALFLQAGRHPSPMFKTAGAPAQPLGNPLPRPRPAEAATRSIELTPADMRVAEPKAESKAELKAEPRSEPRSDAMTSLVAKTTAPAAPAAAAPAAASSASVMRPPAPVPVAAPQTAAGRKIAAVQRTLTEYGYGQLKPTGMIGADTQAAIVKFERDRKLPVTGQMSDRLVRELSAMTGRPVD
ncbi:peptidoglycan-binding domain-containing protein [Bradyrhizobium sp.]|uniref:peptidoglycan-binding domain-containing protein n=1 Tax=Bradyrhizobium sp. TaxID=376 RepID=UPI0025C43970|nr:peptidoglycan-binding domain-containing protein [Bradyrhizobium sp.]